MCAVCVVCAVCVACEMCAACVVCVVCVVCAVCAVFAVLIVCIVQCESMVYQVPAGGKPEPSCPVAASCCRYCTGEGQWSVVSGHVKANMMG